MQQLYLIENLLMILILTGNVIDNLWLAHGVLDILEIKESAAPDEHDQCIQNDTVFDLVWPLM